MKTRRRRPSQLQFSLDDERSDTSSCSRTTRSQESQASQLRCSHGLDVIENVLVTMFGGCCHSGDQSPADCTSQVNFVANNGIHNNASNPNNHYHRNPNNHNARVIIPRKPLSSPGKCLRRRKRHGAPFEEIPQPPEIRRLSLADELQRTHSSQRSESLDFLF